MFKSYCKEYKMKFIYTGKDINISREIVKTGYGKLKTNENTANRYIYNYFKEVNPGDFQLMHTAKTIGGKIVSIGDKIDIMELMNEHN